jgi:hypothetical protein
VFIRIGEVDGGEAKEPALPDVQLRGLDRTAPDSISHSATWAGRPGSWPWTSTRRSPTSTCASCGRCWVATPSRLSTSYPMRTSTPSSPSLRTRTSTTSSTSTTASPRPSPAADPRAPPGSTAQDELRVHVELVNGRVRVLLRLELVDVVELLEVQPEVALHVVAQCRQPRHNSLHDLLPLRPTRPMTSSSTAVHMANLE